LLSSIGAFCDTIGRARSCSIVHTGCLRMRRVISRDGSRLPRAAEGSALVSYYANSVAHLLEHFRGCRPGARRTAGARRRSLRSTVRSRLDCQSPLQKAHPICLAQCITLAPLRALCSATFDTARAAA
jgi:hypothetical protein